MPLRDTIARGLRSLPFPASGGQGSGYGWNRPMGGSEFNYEREAGILLENSIYYACVRWLINAYAETRPIMEAREGKQWVEVENDPLASLLERPNPDYNGKILAAGLLASYLERGSAYAYCVRSGSGKIVQLYYVPHYQITPVWESDGSSYISAYRYTVNGQTLYLPPEDVLVVRNGINPLSLREGLSSTRPNLREFCTDNEAAAITAALSRNMGIPGVYIMPDGVDKQGNWTTIAQATAEKLVATWKQKYGGENRGAPFVFQQGGVKIGTVAFSPEQMLMDKIRNVPEERVTACTGVPAIVVGLGAGLERSTFNNTEQAERVAYRNGLRPFAQTLADAVTHKFENEPGYLLERGTQRIAHDYSQIPALQEDTDKKHTRFANDFETGGITQNEYRAGIGLEPVKGGDKFIWEFDKSAAANDAKQGAEDAGKEGKTSK